MRTLELYGPKSTRQLTELLGCENIYGTLSSPYSLNADIETALKSLYLENLAITYKSESGKWLIKNHNYAKDLDLLSANFADIDLGKVKFKELGCGEEFVYALYLPAMRYNAALNDWKLYPIKIGRTKNLQGRISALSFTGPGMLVPGVVLRTVSSQLIERELHKILITNGAQIRLGNRREWFRSNIADIEYLFSNLTKRGDI